MNLCHLISDTLKQYQSIEKIGVKGAYTDEQLEKIGIKNTVSIVCPSFKCDG